jgi:sugar (pentulose or hexulose) kinase
LSVIAIDIGTSSVKAGLFSQEGQPYASLSMPYAASSETLASGEFDAERWVDAAEALLQDLSGVAFESLKGDPIAALCVSGNGPTLVAAGKDGRAALPALLWIDRRARDEAREISDRLGVEVDPAFYLPKALWILRHRPELSDSITAFMPCPEYLAFRLSGVAHAVLPSRHFERYIWGPELIAGLGLPGGTRMGNLSAGRPSPAISSGPQM